MSLFKQSRFLSLKCALLPSLLVLLVLPTARAQEGETLPQAYPVDRYEPLWKKSPFTLSSAAAPEATAGFAESLALAGVVKINGEYYAAIIDKTTQKRELISSAPNDQGLKLLRVESSDDLTKVEVVLQKGGENSKLRYDSEFLKSSATKTAAENPGNAQGAGNPPPNQPTRQATGAPPPTTRPVRRRNIPSSPNAQPAPGNPQGTPARPAGNP